MMMAYIVLIERMISVYLKREPTLVYYNYVL